jgi:hypothetical protein
MTDPLDEQALDEGIEELVRGIPLPAVLAAAPPAVHEELELFARLIAGAVDVDPGFRRELRARLMANAADPDPEATRRPSAPGRTFYFAAGDAEL